MKLDSRIIKNTYEDYQKKNPKFLEKGIEKLKSNAVEKVKEKAEEIASKGKETLKKAFNLDLSDVAKNIPKEAIATEAIKGSVSVASDLAGAVLSSVTGSDSQDDSKDVGTPKNDLEKIGEEKKTNISNDKKIDFFDEDVVSDNKVKDPALVKLEEALKGPEHKAIYFIRGMKFLSFDYSGIDEMAEAVDGARSYDWDQKEEILYDISKRQKGKPIVLVGHSLGGDTAVEIANELNSLKHRFRPVELLVTMDSVGRDNDIIPKNVAKNMNYITDETMFSDGPNIARDSRFTKVENHLRNERHVELDNSKDIQSQILFEIDKVVL